ncbi:hypothetical protein Tco_0581151, partial [Tanacetum coccineum]
TPKKARKFKKVASPLRKLSFVLEEEPAVKPKRAKKPAKKSTTVPTAGVVIRDTPSEFVPKKKTPAKVVRGKGMDLLSDVALLGVAQLKKTLKKSKLETHKLHASGSGDRVGSLPKVPDEQEDKTTGTDEGTDSGDDDSDDVTKDDDVDSDADGDNEASESEKTDSDEDENPNLNQNDDEKEEYEEELKETEHEEGKGDEEMTDAGHDDGTQQTIYEQVKDDEHVILTTVHDTQNTEVPLQSSFVSSDFANQFLNLDNVPPTDIEVVSMMNVKVRHEEPSTQTPPLLNIPVTVILETSTATRSTILPTIPPITPLPQQSAPTPTLAPKTATTITSIPSLLDFSSLFGFDQRKIKSYRGAQEHKDLYDALVKSYKIDKYLFESYGKVYSLKRDRENKDKDKDEDPPAGSDQGLKKRKTSKDVEPSRASKSKESNSSSSKGTKSQPKSSGKSAQAEEPVFEATDTEMSLNQGDDLGNTDDQPNVEAASRDDWAAKYDAIEGIEDMVPSLWSPVKWYDYGYLEEIVSRREDQQLYKFKEGDFLRLNLYNIEDLLLLLVQKKLSNLERDVIYWFGTLYWRFVRAVHYYSGLSFLTTICPFRQRPIQDGTVQTNILLQGLPRDIYKLINHNTNAKDILDNVKMLLEGSELTKDDRESQLYDEFEHFGQHKGENIHDYCVRFTKLINDMRHIKMTMPKVQLNSKFVNNMLPEWGRFVTTVKLNRGLKESNHDQLYAYLKQHEYPSSSSVPPQFLTFHQSPINLRNRGAQNRAGNANARQGKPIKCYNCNGIENRVDLDGEQLLFVAGGQTNTFDDDVDKGPVQNMAQNEDNIFQADQCDAFNSDVDEAPTAQTMFKANLSSTDQVYDEVGLSYDSDTLSEVQDHDNYIDNMNEYHEEHEMQNDVQPNDIVDSDTTEYTSNSNIILYE